MWEALGKRCDRGCSVGVRNFGGGFEKSSKFAQLGFPLGPFRFGHVQVVSHVAEKFDFHYVNFGDGDARYLRPGLVRVGIIVQDLNC